MTDSPTLFDRTQFHEELTTLLERAHIAGVDVEGVWKCTTDGGGDGEHHWDIQITAVEYNSHE